MIELTNEGIETERHGTSDELGQDIVTGQSRSSDKQYLELDLSFAVSNGTPLKTVEQLDGLN